MAPPAKKGQPYQIERANTSKHSLTSVRNLEAAADVQQFQHILEIAIGSSG
jgi:hypothetical protein